MVEPVTDPQVQFPFSLPKQEIVVTTDVDRLVELLKKKREISVKEASEELGVSLEIVESWVSFLEEEGLVSLNYKFTTPFISYLEHEEEEVVELTPQEKRGGFFMMQEGDVGKKKAEPKPAEPVAKIQHPRPGEALVRPSDVKPEVPVIKRPKPLASVKSSKVPAKLRVEGSLGAQPEQPVVALPKQPAAAKPEEPGNIRAWVEDTYNFIQKGDLHQAQRSYGKVRGHFETIPLKNQKERKEVEHHILKLNRDLSLLMKEAALSYANELEAEITAKLRLLSTQLAKGRVQEAERDYAEVESLYDEFPAELLVRKLALQMEILKHYREIISKKKKILPEDYSASVDVLLHALSRYREQKERNDEAGMSQTHNKIRELYLSLPEDIVAKEVVLNKEVLETVPDVAALRKNLEQGTFREKKAELRKLLDAIKKQLAEKHALEANASYQELNRVYNSLPDGFEDEKTSMLFEIYGLHARLVPMLIEQLKKEFRHHAEKMKKQLKLAERYLAKDKVELARDVYREIVLEFNTLPAGFLEQSTEIRVRLLSLYKEILIKSDVSLLEHLSRPAEEAYRTILALLVNVHAHIENEEFEQIEPACMRISEIIGKLPKEKHKSRVAGEVAKVQKMVELYNSTKRLQHMDIASQQDAVKSLLPGIKALYSSLLKESPEDVMLYRHVYSVYSTYLAALKEGTALTKPKPAPKKPAPVKMPVAAKKVEPKKPAETLEPQERQNLELAKPSEIYSRAVLYLNEGKLGQARECLDILFRKRPEDQHAKRLLNEINTLQSKQDLTSLLVKLKLDRAKHAVAVGDTGTARQNLREVLELDHANQEAKSLLHELTGASQHRPERVEVFHPQIEPVKPAVETPLPPSPAAKESDTLKDKKLQFTAGQRLKEAKLAISNKDFATAEEKLLDCLGIGPKNSSINKQATDLLKTLKEKQGKK